MVYTTSKMRSDVENPLECQKRHGFLPIIRYRVKMKLCKYLQTWAAEAALKSPWQDDGNIPEMYRPIERFVCNVYSDRSGLDTLPSLRWELFRKKNLEGDNLPPTCGTLLPHIVRANYMSMRDKSYTTVIPKLPPLEQNGWEVSSDEGYLSIKCLNKPAPEAVLELVKCGCRGQCQSANCCCLRNDLSCTALCKCTDC